ncbi:MAG: molybdopterin-binding protein [Methanocellales archaeon]|nr:molybdopterin-binding protein [Methanocellales archaeon]MDD3291692.1 molybdopterin-binding protein [Methanocellales archaeon]MDD5235042.1 molybdopterin-binding protein [Methanocellales archaeon]MDD5485180.1 molybdopterin-binding protein [Methanocellales archaeon]
MKPFKSLIPLEKALKIMEKALKPIDRTESISIKKSLGRVLSGDVIAEIDVPPFDRAAMDGYALRAEDTYGANNFEPKILRKIDEIYAGEVSDKIVHRGECIQISTGCKMPSGSDAVMMVESTDQIGAEVKMFKPVYPKENVSPMGEDIAAGSIVLKPGEVLNPSKIGALAALGIQKINVYEKPRVAIIPTGDEIADLGSELKEGQVYDINSYTLSSIVEENGGAPIKFEIVPDTNESIRAAVKNSLEYDLISFSGGSSVGERDILHNVIEEVGTILFHGVQIKPGKPTLCGIVDKKLVFGIPGYPTSCLSNGYRFLLPAVRKIARLPPKRFTIVKARISRRVVSSLGRSQFLTVRLEGQVAHPVFKESGAITSMADADGYVDIPADVDLIEAGDEVEVILLM